LPPVVARQLEVQQIVAERQRDGALSEIGRQVDLGDRRKRPTRGLESQQVDEKTARVF
jgi:hypothetical protein